MTVDDCSLYLVKLLAFFFHFVKFLCCLSVPRKNNLLAFFDW